MLDRQKRTRSLVAYAFVLVCILLAAALGAGAYLYYSDYQRHYRVQVENQLSAIGKLKADDLANWRGERLADASALHKNAAFAALAKRYLDDPGDPQAEAELRSWLESYQEYQQYDQVRLLDAQGATRLSVPAGVPPVAPAISERLPEILQSGRVTFLDFYRDDHDQRVHLAALVPIVDGEGSHQALGAVVLRIDPTPYLYPFIARWPTPSETAETLLVRRDGNDALFLNEVRFQKDTALTLRISLASRDVPAVKAALGQEGIVEGVDYRGVRVIADVRSVPDSPWFLVACMDAAEVYAPVRERLWQLVIVVAALLFGAGACVGLAWWQRSGQFYRERAAAVETIRETRDYLENLINHASAPIIVWDPQFRITRFNRAFESLTGRRADDVTGKSLEILFPRASLGSSMELIKKTQTGERWETAEIAILHLDGSVRTVLWNSATLFSADGKTPVATIAQGQDVTERKRVEENTRRMATVVRDSNDAITIQDFEGRITAWNQGAELMYGYSEQEALAANIDLLTAPGKIAEQRDFIRRLMAGEDVTSFETQRVTKDGHVLDVWMTVTRLMDDAGKPVGLASTERDITARKRKEEDLRRMATVVRDSNDAITIQDFEGGITAWNRGAELMYGYSEQEALAANIDLLTAPGKIAEQRDFIRRLMAGEDVTSFETQRVTKDGHVLDVWMTVTRLMDDAGKPVGLASTERDITARKRKEEDLRRMATVVRDSNDAITIQDFEGRITAWNRGAELMYGYSEEEALAMNIDLLTPPGKIAEHRDFIRRLVAGEDVTSFETQRVTKDGHVLDVWMTVTKLMDHAGKPIGLGSTERDITARKREEDVLRLNAEIGRHTGQLEAAYNELEAFSYSVSHDLRAPLRHVQGYVDMLARDAESQLSENGRRYMRTIADASREMGVLIDDLLAFSRTGRTQMAETTVSLNGLVQESIQSLEVATRGRNIVWTLPPLPAVHADPAMLRLALTNLLSNAVKFTSPRDPAQIEIGSAGTEDGRAILFVRDNGVGFDPQYAHKLFGVFQRLHRSDEFEGTGIGLANVRRIIARHGGRTWAEGKLNEGATFYFTLKASE